MTEKQGDCAGDWRPGSVNPVKRVTVSARGVVVYLETTIEKRLARTQRDGVLCYKVDAPPREVLKRWLTNVTRCMKIADVTIRTDDQSAKVVANQIIRPC
ncbi:hypothetical protein MJ561_27000 [Klebsiella pneumoniae]|nr:hypothetical protein MJ561_27000 [Klebsiella pneumoniae]